MQKQNFDVQIERFDLMGIIGFIIGHLALIISIYNSLEKRRENKMQNNSKNIPAADSIGGKITADMKTGAMNKSTERDPLSKALIDKLPSKFQETYKFEKLMVIIERVTSDMIKFGDDIVEGVLRLRSLIFKHFRAFNEILESVK